MFDCTMVIYIFVLYYIYKYEKGVKLEYSAVVIGILKVNLG